MKPVHDCEVVELMVAANTDKTSYARALLATSLPQDVYKPDQLQKAASLTPEQMARIECEMAAVNIDLRIWSRPTPTACSRWSWCSAICGGCH